MDYDLTYTKHGHSARLRSGKSRKDLWIILKDI